MTDEPAHADFDDDCAGVAWGWDGDMPFTEETTRQAAIIGYQETSELRA